MLYKFVGPPKFAQEIKKENLLGLSNCSQSEVMNLNLNLSCLPQGLFVLNKSHENDPTLSSSVIKVVKA